MSTKGRHYTRVHGQQGPIAEMSEECETLGEGVHAIDLQRSKPNIQSGGCYSRAVQEQIDSGTKEQAVNSQTEEPTPASVWQSLTGRTISDEFLDWPADVFALTEVILRRSEVHRFALSPPAGWVWPPSRISDWPEAVEEAGRQWSLWVENQKTGFPELVAEEWRAFRQRVGMSLDDLAAGRDWRMCEALLTLHAIADEACAGLGAALDGDNRKGCIYRAHGRELLARTRSLARVRTPFLRVLPKLRSPAGGASCRSFSRYACVHDGHVDARWHKVPVRRVGTDVRARRANLLLLPWPLRVRESDFRPLEGSVHTTDTEPFGFFEFSPSEKLDLDLVSRLIVAAREEVDSVDAVMLPESAIDESEVDELEALLESHGVGTLIAGVRRRSAQPGQFPGNWVHLGTSPRFEKGASLPSSTPEQWFHVRQNKQNRWLLDEKQIYQYHLGGALHPQIRWWDATDVPRRAVQFVELGDGITLVFLVCEDLAQIDDVAEVVRSVGPTLVYTPVLDGPQLSTRWAARYASVLADDPGSAVLTLTSYGMVERSRPHGRAHSPVVGLCKDPVRGLREIPLEPGAQGVLLAVCGGRATRRSTDGRHPVDNVTEYFDVAVHQVRVDPAKSPLPNFQPTPLAPSALGNDELTILTGWAQALAEALVHDPDCVEALLADAQGKTQWRARLGLPEPSSRLSQALYFLGEAVRAIASQNGNFTLDALHISIQQDRPAEDALDRLARRVLRSTLEQVRTQ